MGKNPKVVLAEFSFASLTLLELENSALGPYSQHFFFISSM
jgi:hypothetical protein